MDAEQLGGGDGDLALQQWQQVDARGETSSLQHVETFLILDIHVVQRHMAQEAIVQAAYADAGTQLLSQHACRLAPQIFLNGGDAKS